MFIILLRNAEKGIFIAQFGQYHCSRYFLRFFVLFSANIKVSNVRYMNVIYKCTKLSKTFFTVDTIGGVQKPRNTKNTSCSLYFRNCCFLHFFPFHYLIEEEFCQNVKVWNYWSFTRYMIMVSVNYPHPSMLVFRPLWKKKILITHIIYVLTVPMTMSFNFYVFYCGRISFFLFASLW